MQQHSYMEEMQKTSSFKEHTRHELKLQGMSIFLGLVFIISGLVKLLSVDVMVSAFESWGYSTELMFAVGAAELLGGLMVLVPRTTFYAFNLLGFVMVGAFATHLLEAQYALMLVPALLFAGLTYLAYHRAPENALVGYVDNLS